MATAWATGSGPRRDFGYGLEQARLGAELLPFQLPRKPKVRVPLGAMVEL